MAQSQYAVPTLKLAGMPVRRIFARRPRILFLKIERLRREIDWRPQA